MCQAICRYTVFNGRVDERQAAVSVNVGRLVNLYELGLCLWFMVCVCVLPKDHDCVSNVRHG